MTKKLQHTVIDITLLRVADDKRTAINWKHALTTLLSSCKVKISKLKLYFFCFSIKIAFTIIFKNQYAKRTTLRSPLRKPIIMFFRPKESHYYFFSELKRYIKHSAVL